MTVSPSRRVIAIAERINDRPSVTVYDLQTGKRRKTLQPESIKSTDIVSLMFSSDSKYLLTQCGAPDYTLIYWSWEKGKVMASIDVKPTTGPQTNTTVNQVNFVLISFYFHVKIFFKVSFNPQDNTQMCVVGHGLFKMFRYNDSTLKLSQSLKQENYNFTCHSWISDDRLLAGTDQGKLFVIQNGEILHEIKIDSKSESRFKLIWFFC
jgi:WD40 repeat protein